MPALSNGKKAAKLRERRKVDPTVTPQRFRKKIRLSKTNRALFHSASPPSLLSATSRESRSAQVLRVKIFFPSYLLIAIPSTM